MRHSKSSIVYSSLEDAKLRNVQTGTTHPPLAGGMMDFWNSILALKERKLIGLTGTIKGQHFTFYRMKPPLPDWSEGRAASSSCCLESTVNSSQSPPPPLSLSLSLHTLFPPLHFSQPRRPYALSALAACILSSLNTFYDSDERNKMPF